MGCGGYSRGSGWGPGGFGLPEGGFGFGGFDGPGFGSGCGPGFGPGHGFGHGKMLKRAAFGTAALLLDGPADAAQIVQRATEATGGAFTPPQEVAELAIELLATKGVVTVEGGVATLTDFGQKILTWRGVTSESAKKMMGRAGRFADVIKIRTGMQDVAGMARTIMSSGTEAQRAKLGEVRSRLTKAVEDARRELHAALAES